MMKPLSRYSDRYLDVPRVTCQVGVPLADQPKIGHNRWHPEIPPAVTVDPGGEVILESAAYDDYQIHDNGGLDELRHVDLSRMHPLTGPVHVDGARPGDVLVAEVLGVEPLSGIAFANILPGTPGLLGEIFPDGYRSTWYAHGGIAESPQVPGVRVPAQPHAGTMGVAPSYELMRRWDEREKPLYADGRAFPPDPRNALLRGLGADAARMAARTQPPRENGGNMDINTLGPGATVYFPVFVEGALLSLGDHHLAAADGECSFNAMEMDGRTWLRLRLIKDGMARHRITTPIVRPAPLVAQFGADRYLGFTGFCFRGKEQRYQDASFATQEAVRRAVDYLMGLGYSGEQAYVILSVAPVEIRVSCIVTIPNPTVTLYLPIDIFDRNVLPS
ncbi:acetamidase/formamidase family protein [Nonomuraea sp. LP-02]|uniref:acetamidase/formamidase family protein n=1 Tax=Nonomuraea sp. LP-02 TaxID=3097960 RepID=UPI002E34FA37|nr:acetamidase/formamidase family protein [Nonomuraea sp. LP-02]MED7931154.1 acetamidase/formamidase family protein [Nonomuraea sp. LP-02]